ncbi:MAG: response regulator transcription factor [Nevskiales bacterium]
MSTLLLIDDDALFCRVLGQALTRRGLQVWSAHDGLTALAQAREHRPLRAVLDLNLNGESGLKLIAPLRDAAPGIEILLLTGYASLSTAVAAIKLGAVNYLAKPVDADAVLAAFDASPTVGVLSADPLTLRRLEWEHIQRVLGENEGNISAAARQLGLHRRTLQRRLRKRP